VARNSANLSSKKCLSTQSTLLVLFAAQTDAMARLAQIADRVRVGVAFLDREFVQGESRAQEPVRLALNPSQFLGLAAGGEPADPDATPRPAWKMMP
jgi:hypothetical protein